MRSEHELGPTLREAWEGVIRFCPCNAIASNCNSFSNFVSQVSLLYFLGQMQQKMFT